MNEVPKLLIFRQKPAKKGQMEKSRNEPMTLITPINLDGVVNQALKPMADSKLITKSIIFQ
jgi:hypothetical protein